LRRATGFPLDDLTFILTHFLPHLNRDAVYRILKAEGLNRLSPAQRTRKCSATIRMVTRIASPEMLPAVWSLPHLICSRRRFDGGGGDEAGEHGDAR